MVRISQLNLELLTSYEIVSIYAIYLHFRISNTYPYVTIIMLVLNRVIFFTSALLLILTVNIMLSLDLCLRVSLCEYKFNM